jgi:hypothetical protein
MPNIIRRKQPRPSPPPSYINQTKPLSSSLPQAINRAFFLEREDQQTKERDREKERKNERRRNRGEWERDPVERSTERGRDSPGEKGEKETDLNVWVPSR